MRINAEETSLGNFGGWLPSLKQLRLNNSVIPSIRDLGSSLEKVRVLWLARCCLHELDGINCFRSIQELYLAYNDVADLSACALLDSLRILDLEGNNVDDISQIQYLAFCRKLFRLTLEGNPICVTPSPDVADPNYDYRFAIRDQLPHLKYLDDEPLSQLKRAIGNPRADVNEFEHDWDLIGQIIQETSLGSEENLVENQNEGSRPASAMSGTPTHYRPISALKQRPATALRPVSTPDSENRPDSGSSGSLFASVALDGAGESALTCGPVVVCGTPAQALRATKSRKPPTPKMKADQPAADFTPSGFETATKLAFEEHMWSGPEKTTDPPVLDDEEADALMSELKRFRSQNLRRIEAIQESRQPQVLRIDSPEERVIEAGDDINQAATGECSEDEEDFLSNSASTVTGNQQTETCNQDNNKKSPSPKPPTTPKSPSDSYSAGFRQQRFRKSNATMDTLLDSNSSATSSNQSLPEITGVRSLNDHMPLAPDETTHSLDYLYITNSAHDRVSLADDRLPTAPSAVGLKPKFRLKPKASDVGNTNSGGFEFKHRPGNEPVEILEAGAAIQTQVDLLTRAPSAKASLSSGARISKQQLSENKMFLVDHDRSGSKDSDNVFDRDALGTSSGRKS